MARDRLKRSSLPRDDLSREIDTVGKSKEEERKSTSWKTVGQDVDVFHSRRGDETDKDPVVPNFRGTFGGVNALSNIVHGAINENRTVCRIVVLLLSLEPRGTRIREKSEKRREREGDTDKWEPRGEI